MVVQSISFPKDKFTPASARQWLDEHGFIYPKIHETSNFYRFRQDDPSKYEHYENKYTDDGVLLTIGMCDGCRKSQKTRDKCCYSQLRGSSLKEHPFDILMDMKDVPVYFYNKKPIYGSGLNDMINNLQHEMHMFHDGSEQVPGGSFNNTNTYSYCGQSGPLSYLKRVW